ncbi:ABC transporter G family member 10 [Lactuca sativa]|uniref:ABC transporter G family member 10 n=1 Tax=Lactuca sativa TaxID=4236 RepID=UPI000CB998D4|nr:ABC transporter G family member 10 [Lactuca sativa]
MVFQLQSADFCNLKTQYKINAKSVSYGIFPTYLKFGWLRQHKVNPILKKQILRDVNCEVTPGEITAIAGPSGAGKTTLIEVLGGVIPPCRLSGEVLVNDRPMNSTFFRRVSGYVTQEDLLFPLLTVEETLLYSARLRLPGGLDKSKARVQDLLVELGLCHVSGERIGGDNHRGISGGEKRRVSIGVDLVHDPSVLLMDEPTSGLDSGAAFQLISMLHSMAKNHHKTIVLTIHQPGFRILELFDKIMLLANGTMVHHGSLNSLEHKLKSAGHDIPRQVNVLEFSMDVIETLIPDVMETVILDMNEPKPQFNGINQDYHLQYPNCVLTEIAILSERFMYTIFRTKELFIGSILQGLLVGLLFGMLFKDMNRSHTQTQIGFFASSVGYLLYTSSQAIPIFFNECWVLMREISTGAYRISSYTIANTLVFLPILFIVALLFAIPTYLLVGLRDDLDGFFLYLLIVWLTLLMSNSFVSLFSVLVSNFMMGISSVAILMGTFSLFSGFFIVNDDIPKYLMFMHHLSLVRYPFESLLINEFGGSKGRWRCLQRSDGGCLVSGEQFLKNENLKDVQKWYNLGMMVVFIFGYRFLSFMVLCYRSYRSRN